jgi:hypothetical protein
MGLGRFTGRAVTLAYCLVFSALALAAWAWLTGSLHPWARLAGKVFLVIAMLSMLVSVLVLVTQMILRLSEEPNPTLRLLDEDWAGERRLIEMLRAYPVDVLEPLSRRLKVEIQLLERAIPRANLLGALCTGVTALWLAFAPPAGPTSTPTPARSAEQAKPESASPDTVKILVAALAVSGVLAALLQNPAAGKLMRLELLVAEACLGERSGAPCLSQAPARQTWRQKLKAEIGRISWLQALAKWIEACGSAAKTDANVV